MDADAESSPPAPLQSEAEARQTRDSLVRCLDGLADPFFACGHASLPCVRGTDGQTFHFPADIEKLCGLCVQASFGYGEKTLVDSKVRQTLETEAIEVEWADLQRVLDQVRSKLCPDSLLRAKLYKVLVYRPGDFFKPHVDSKREDDHLLTLVVDCGAGPCDGGEVWFLGHAPEDQNEISKPKSDKAGYAAQGSEDGSPTPDTVPSVQNLTQNAWKSNQGGDWCCWFTSELHSVKSVKSGCRVVACFDILASPCPYIFGKLPEVNPIAQLHCLPAHVLESIFMFSGSLDAKVILSF